MKIKLLRDITFNNNPPNGILKSFTAGTIIEAELIGPYMFKTPWGYLYKGEYSVVEPDTGPLMVRVQDQYYTLEEITINSYTWPDELNIEAAQAVARAIYS